ncbi:MAG: hypothetical protein K0S65_3401 [Labilithrix sp.]|nr:hypothetical protein [Labilithrix sp.]
MTKNLVSHFASAGLELRLASSPFAGGRNAASIFQLDIRRARPHDVRSEHFLAWLGGSGNLAAVQGSDSRERQLVLAVREGETEFEESVPRWMVQSATGTPGSMEWKKAIAARAGVGVSANDIVARSGGASIVRFTRGSTRHMLVGRDERQLFMCELPRPCTSVRQAHEALRTPAARSRSRSALDQPIRQGEWFFLPVTGPEIDELETAIRKSRVVVRRKTSINSVIPRAGKPHIADEIAVVVRRSGLPDRSLEPRVYARGAIRHADHKTIHIRQWRRVLRNLEVDQGRSPFGGTWID